MKFETEYERDLWVDAFKRNDSLSVKACTEYADEVLKTFKERDNYEHPCICTRKDCANRTYR